MNNYFLELTKDELSNLEQILENVTPDNPDTITDQSTLNAIGLLSKIGQLASTNPDDILHSIWHIDDVLYCNCHVDKDGNDIPRCTPEQAREVLKAIKHNHD